MQGVELQQLIRCERGGLYLVNRGTRGRGLVRALDRRLADADFVQAVDDLKRRLERHPAPRVLPIVNHDFVGDYYQIEYRLDWRTRCVPDYFRGTHWLKRLRFLRTITSVYDEWRQTMRPPVALHPGGVVACDLNGSWMAHLAPCPRIPLSSPYELIHLDPEVLAGIAPERLRSPTVPPGAPEDVFAAGALIPQALGVQDFSREGCREAMLEAQARGLLVTVEFDRSGIDSALPAISAVEDAFTELRAAVLRSTAFSPEARPPGLKEIQTALDRVLAFEDAPAMAARLEKQPPETLQFLEWWLASSGSAPGETLAMRRLAADVCNRLKLPSRELFHLEKAGADSRTRRRMMQLRWEEYLKKGPSQQNAGDPEGDRILKELEQLRPTENGDLDTEERLQAKEDRIRAAMIYGRRGDLHGRARELYEVTKLDYADIDGLYLYGLALRDLGAQPETMNQLIAVAKHRGKQLAEAGILADEELQAWTERFQSLRHR